MGKREEAVAKVPYGAREKMPLWYSLAWSTRGISLGISVVILMQITFYCTDILGLNPAIIGTMFMLSKVIDAFTDLGFGFILDKTHTRWGKARPYEIFIVFQWIFTIFVFNAPNIGETAQYVWIFIMYVLINAVCSTVLGGSDSVYISRAFTTNQNQIKAMSVSGIVVMIITIAFNIWFPGWLATSGQSHEGWATLIVPFGIAMALVGILRFVFCKEIVVDKPRADDGKVKTNNLSFIDSLKILSKNKYLYIVVGLTFLTFWINNMAAATTYYFKYIVGDISLQGTIAITSIIVVPALVVFPMLSKKFGTTKILRAASLIGVLDLLIRTIGGTNVATLIIGGLLMGIGTLPVSLMINTYLIDCMDYGEWKSGIRIEGMVASIGNFFSKVGNGVAFGFVGFVMGIAGYDGLSQVQSDTALRAIVFLYNIVPMILFALMFVLSLNYKVDEIRPQMEADLKAKHEAQ